MFLVSTTECAVMLSSLAHSTWIEALHGPVHSLTRQGFITHVTGHGNVLPHSWTASCDQ